MPVEMEICWSNWLPRPDMDSWSASERLSISTKETCSQLYALCLHATPDISPVPSAQFQLQFPPNISSWSLLLNARIIEIYHPDREEYVDTLRGTLLEEGDTVYKFTDLPLPPCLTERPRWLIKALSLPKNEKRLLKIYGGAFDLVEGNTAFLSVSAINQGNCTEQNSLIHPMASIAISNDSPNEKMHLSGDHTMSDWTFIAHFVKQAVDEAVKPLHDRITNLELELQQLKSSARANKLF